MPISKEEILERFKLFNGNTGGIDSWLSNAATNDIVFQRLGDIASDPLSRVQLNQLLLLSHEAGVSLGFYEYYWFSVPDHTYEVTKVGGYDSAWTIDTEIKSIVSLDHLRWGLYRFYMDALLYFGNIRFAYRILRNKSKNELVELFQNYKYSTEEIEQRGPALELNKFAKDDRYLISEMACKSMDAPNDNSGSLKTVLFESLQDHLRAGGKTVKIKKLLDGTYIKNKQHELQFNFSANEILEESVSTEKELEKEYSKLEKKFTDARSAAL